MELTLVLPLTEALFEPQQERITGEGQGWDIQHIVPIRQARTSAENEELKWWSFL